MISPERLALALDTPDLAQAQVLADELSDFFGVLKIGLTLWASEGPNAVKVLKKPGRQIFLDLKLHDIPHQVGRAAEVISTLDVDYLTLHSAGGKEMLSHGVTGLSKNRNIPPKALAITVLTSHADFDPKVFEQRVRLAEDSGCSGIVCSAQEIATAKALSPDIFCAVPGIRLEDGDNNDQARPGTAEAAISAGADLLVVGRAVTAASNPQRAAQQLLSI